MDIVAYKVGSRWVISIWEDFNKCWVERMMPNYYRSKKSIKEYCKSVYFSSVIFFELTE